MPMSGSDSVREARTRLSQPHLSVGQARQKPVHGGKLVSVQFVGARIRIDGNKFTKVFRRNPRRNVALVKPIAASRHFFLRVAPVYAASVIPHHGFRLIFSFGHHPPFRIHA
jgi:hypothetical protein